MLVVGIDESGPKSSELAIEMVSRTANSIGKFGCLRVGPNWRPIAPRAASGRGSPGPPHNRPAMDQPRGEAGTRQSAPRPDYAAAACIPRWIISDALLAASCNDLVERCE